MRATVIAIETLTPDVIRRFESKTYRSENGCLEWLGAKDKLGYGRFKLNGRMLLSHRVSMTVRNGLLPDGLVVDHVCRNPSCVDPDHLELVTQAENTARGMSPTAAAVRSVLHENMCVNGHDQSIYLAIRKSGHHRCRECERLNSARRDARDRLSEEHRERKRLHAQKARAEGRWK